MANSLAERRPFLLLLVLLTVNLVLMSSRVRSEASGSILERGVLSISSPFLKAASWIARGTVGSWKGYAALRGVEEENERLRAEVDALALRAREKEEVQQEVLRLRDLLELRQEIEYPSVAAHVIARGASDGARILLLDRGGSSGLRRNQPVITPRGVVGRIIEAAAGIAKLQTILDPNSGVAALIQRTRAQGLIVGQGEGALRMEYVSDLESVEVGDVVVTSGLDQIYPKGYIIGTVVATGVGEGLTKDVDVRPEVDFGRLEEVLVLLKPEGVPGQETP
jgi:rod shape-determining protein MreC